MDLLGAHVRGMLGDVLESHSWELPCDRILLAEPAKVSSGKAGGEDATGDKKTP